MVNLFSCFKFQTDFSISGDLDISVAFQAPHTLLVTVHGANNLAPRDEGETADPFVKVAVSGCNKVFQTQVCDWQTRTLTWVFLSFHSRYKSWCYCCFWWGYMAQISYGILDDLD